jgi:dCMP deaminase
VHSPQPNEDFLSRWGDKIKVSEEMFEQAGVQVDWMQVD